MPAAFGVDIRPYYRPVVHNDPIAQNAVEARDVPPLPAPWRPADGPGPPMRGCGKPLLLGCGCAATAIVAGLMLLGAKAPEVIAWQVGLMKSQVLSGLPDDTSALQRSRLEAAFAAFPAAVASGRLPLDRLFEVFGEINAAIAGAQRGELTGDDVERLIDALERAVASSGPPANDGVRAATTPRAARGELGGAPT
jgi:hypothetical protein